MSLSIYVSEGEAFISQDDRQKRLTIDKILSMGGQGQVVDVVDSNGAHSAVKFYFPHTAKEEQKNKLSRLIANTFLERDVRLVNPKSLVIHETDPQLWGYEMDLVDTDLFVNYDEIRFGATNPPHYPALLKICYQAADIMHQLNTSGFSYGDVSINNIFVNPESGDIRLIDNDNIDILGESKSVFGTPEYRPPEALDANYKSNEYGDRYSLSILFFMYWFWQHPFTGELCNGYIDDDRHNEIYIKHPVFIFHPTDTSNRPFPADLEKRKRLQQRWDDSPEQLKEFFLHNFCGEGLHNPELRKSADEWMTLFRDLSDKTLMCAKEGCYTKNMWDGKQSQITCFGCGSTIEVPLWLESYSENGERVAQVLLPLGKTLQSRHLSLQDNLGNYGEIISNPKNPNQWGIKNCSPVSWQKLDGSNQVLVEVPPGQILGLQQGVRFKVGIITAEIKG